MHRRSGRSVAVFAAAWAALLFVAIAWVFASPLSSGPDESGHVMKAAAAVRGQFVGEPTDVQGISRFRLPADVADVGGPMTCFAGRPTQPANCAPSFDDAGRQTVMVDSGVGSYYPLYYVLVGWPSLVTHGPLSFFGMRTASAVLNTFLLAMVFWVAARSARSRGLLVGLAVATTPMVLYLGSMVNASGTEVSGAAAVVALGWSILHARRRPARSEAILLAVAVVLTGSARTTSPLIVALVIVALAATVPWRRLRAVAAVPSVWRSAAAAAIALVPALLWSVLVAVPAGYIPSSDPARPGPLAAVWHSLWSLGDYGRGMIGVLGWQDTLLPEPVITGWTAGIGAALVIGLAATRRSWVAVALLSAGVLFLPAAVQATSAERWGYIWQGRYGLALLVSLVLVAVVLGMRSAVRPNAIPRLVGALWTAWVVAQITVFVIAYHRYSVGVDGSWKVMYTGGGWQARGGLVLWLVLDVVGSLGLLATALVAAGSRRARYGLRSPVSGWTQRPMTRRG